MRSSSRLFARLGALVALLSGSLASCGTQPPPLLLLVTVDTLRADHLGRYGADPDATPNLDALARKSVVFEAAYAAAPFTLPSVSSILTGRHPETLAIHSNASLVPDDVPTVATRLAERGWRTLAVVSNDVLKRQSGLARGFDTYDDAMLEREAVRDLPERTAAATTDAALRLLGAAAESPLAAGVFLWVHYQDPHGPYTPPDGLRERFLPRAQRADDARRRLPIQPGVDQLGAIPAYQVIDDRRDVGFYRAGYLGEVHYLDREVGRLLETLGSPERGASRRGFTVFTADHGESLGESDFWFAHGLLLSEALIRVPLFIRGEGVAPGRRQRAVSLVDLHATLLALADALEDGSRVNPGPANLLAPDANATGSAAYSASLSRIATRRFALVEGRHKLLRTHSPAGVSDQLYRLEPGGNAARIDAEPVARRLGQQLAALRVEYVARRDERLQQLSDADRARLQALGYTASGEIASDLPAPAGVPVPGGSP